MSCQAGEMDPASPLHTVSCFCTFLLWVHFSLKSVKKRHLNRQHLLQWIFSYLALFTLLIKTKICSWYKCKILSFPTEQRADEQCWADEGCADRPWIWQSWSQQRWSQAQLGTLPIVQQGQGHLLTPERLTCKKQSWLEGKAHFPMQHRQTPSLARSLGREKKEKLEFKTVER